MVTSITKYNYQDLREEVEQWSSPAAGAHGGWQRPPWEDGQRGPEDWDLDMLGDTSGHGIDQDAARKDEMLGLIVLAEAAEASGDTARADRLVDEIHQILSQGAQGVLPEHAGPGGAGEFDPRPPDVPRISLLDTQEHDYAALLRAVDLWQQAQERAIDHSKTAQMSSNTRDDATHFADTMGDGAGARYHQVQTKADELRACVRAAMDFEKQGRSDEADRLIEGLQDTLGITDAAVPQIETYLYDAARKSASRRRLLALLGAGLLVAGGVAAVYRFVR